MTCNQIVRPVVINGRARYENTKRRIVSSRPILLNQKQGGGVNNYTTFLGRMMCPIGVAGARDIQAVYANWYQGVGDQVDVATITIRSAIDITSPATQNRATLFRGSKSISLAAGEYVLADLAPYECAAGTILPVRTELTVATPGDLWPVGGSAEAGLTGEGFYQNYDPTNSVYYTGPIVAGTGTTSMSYGPIALIGTPIDNTVSQSAVIGLGDSIMYGTGDTMHAGTGTKGWLRVLSSLNVPSLQQGRSSDQAQYQAASWRKRFMWKYGTHLLCNFGTNDIAAGRSVAQLQADLTAIWTAAKRYNLHVTQILILPRTNGSNVPVSGFEAGGKRDQINDWILTQVGNGVLDMAVDPNPGVENTTTSGAWVNINYTDSNDGIHMTPASYNIAFANFHSWLNTL